MITIVPYNPTWPSLFAKEAASLRVIFRTSLLDIHHIGSTAIEGMAAKAVIDIMAVVHDITAIDALNMQMQDAGYQAMGEYGITARRYYRKEIDGQRTHNLHCYAAGHPDIERCLYFRNYLRESPQDAEKYILLKQALAAQFPEDMDTYTKSKNAFVKAILDTGKSLSQTT